MLAWLLSWTASNSSKRRWGVAYYKFTTLYCCQVEKGDSGFCLPYEMEKGKIRDPATGSTYSVKMQFNSEEQWTKAMKYMLTNLKWGLAWVTSKYSKQD